MRFRLQIGVAALVIGAGALAHAADDGAALYKSRCAACHGASGEGKPAMKAPALKGTKLDADQIAAKITQGSPDSKAPHNKGLAGLTADQAKAIAAYVKSM
jgi:cytochrome c